MQPIGMGPLEILVIFVVLALPLISLIHLAGKKLTGMPLALWVLIICAIPVLGSLAYWIIRPAAENRV